VTETQQTGAEQHVRIFLLDDHEVVRRGIAELLSAVPGFEIVGEAGTVEQALARVMAAKPDVAVLDARLPDGSGIDVCREIRSALPDTYCLILTSYDDQDAVLSSVLAGASGYVLKEVRTSGLVDAIRQVALGRSQEVHGPEDTRSRYERRRPRPDSARATSRTAAMNPGRRPRVSRKSPALEASVVCRKI